MMPALYKMRMPIPEIMAMMKLQITPAAETQRFATRLFRQRNGFTGVGLAQPIKGACVKKAMAGKSSVPIGSTCDAGFKLIRPCDFARSSPNRFDIQAWADS